MSRHSRGDVIRALGRMEAGAALRGHYSYSRLDAAWTRAAIDLLCNDHEQLEMVRQDSATAWDKCEERRKNEERLKALIAELLDDPIVIDGAPPGLGWFERAEEAVGRPVGSSFDKATLRRREEQALTMSMFLRKEDLEDERSSQLSSHQQGIENG